MSNLLFGSDLVAVLSLTTADVKLLERDGGQIRITPAQALRLARTGVYEGGGTRSRVKYIRETNWQDRITKILKAAEFESGTPEVTGRGCIRFFTDQRSEVFAH